MENGPATTASFQQVCETMKRCVITIAVGNSYYHRLAENLLLSFLLWNKFNDIGFLLITDCPEFYSKFYGKLKINIKEIKISQHEKSFTSKFRLFEQALADENLFVDCDCLIYKSLDFVFDSFRESNFSVIGNQIINGHFFCDVTEIISKFGIKALPKFVGSIYYFKKNDKVYQIFNKAEELKHQYDNLGFLRLRNKENEEPLFALAMSLKNEFPIKNNGKIKADAMFYKKIRSNIATGYTILTCPLYEEAKQEVIPNLATPAIIHFNDKFTESAVYKADALRLSHPGHSRILLEIFILVRYFLPDRSINFIKNLIRPVYHFIFGVRKIKKSKRID
jgi:hypothetical protein